MISARVSLISAQISCLVFRCEIAVAASGNNQSRIDGLHRLRAGRMVCFRGAKQNESQLMLARGNGGIMKEVGDGLSAREFAWICQGKRAASTSGWPSACT